MTVAEHRCRTPRFFRRRGRRWTCPKCGQAFRCELSPVWNLCAPWWVREAPIDTVLFDDDGNRVTAPVWPERTPNA